MSHCLPLTPGRHEHCPPNAAQEVPITVPTTSQSQAAVKFNVSDGIISERIIGLVLFSRPVTREGSQEDLHFDL